MGGAKIVNHSNSDIEVILEITKGLAKGTKDYKDVPWLKHAYFCGRTLCIDMMSNGVEDVMTFSHGDETVGFFSGGFRKLLSIKACTILEEIMVQCAVQHDTKWIKP